MMKVSQNTFLSMVDAITCDTIYSLSATAKRALTSLGLIRRGEWTPAARILHASNSDVFVAHTLYALMGQYDLHWFAIDRPFIRSNRLNVALFMVDFFARFGKKEEKAGTIKGMYHGWEEYKRAALFCATVAPGLFKASFTHDLDKLSIRDGATLEEVVQTVYDVWQDPALD